MDEQNALQSMFDFILGSRGFHILLILTLTLMLLWTVRKISRRIFQAMKRRKILKDEEAQKRVDTLSDVFRFVANIIIVGIGILMMLKELSIDIGPILAAAGVLGLAVGFGAQSLIKDLISGFFIFFEDQIRVGDVVQVAGKAGVVERMNLKMTILRDLSGNVHFVPNGQIDVVTNMTKVYSRYVLDIGVAYREDVDEVIGVMKAVDEELRNDPDFGPDIIEPLEVLGLNDFADSALIIRARTTTKPIKQWRVGREFKRRLKKRFDALGIEIPFPHQTVYFGEDKQGDAPPLRVRKEP